MTLAVSVLIVLAVLTLGAAIYVAVARRSPEGGRGHNAPIDVYAVTAGAMSLLIAFTISMTFGLYNQAADAVRSEAFAVQEMSRAALFMSPELRDNLRDQLVCYGEQVSSDEWATISQGDEREAASVRATLRKMDTALVGNIAAAGAGMDMWESANEARTQARHSRLMAAGSSVPPILWFLLVVGSFLTLGSLFVYADRSKPAWGHMMVVIGPLFVASAAMVVIAFFDHPYSETPGGVTMQPMRDTISNLTTEQIGEVPLPSCPGV